MSASWVVLAGCMRNAVAARDARVSLPSRVIDDVLRDINNASSRAAATEDVRFAIDYGRGDADGLRITVTQHRDGPDSDQTVFADDILDRLRQDLFLMTQVVYGRHSLPPSRLRVVIDILCHNEASFHAVAGKVKDVPGGMHVPEVTMRVCHETRSIADPHYIRRRKTYVIHWRMSEKRPE